MAQRNNTAFADLLAVIAADPEADAPRLALADWWEAHGQPQRAELMRLQLAITAGQDRWLHPRIREMRQRQEELLRAHETLWRSRQPCLEGVQWTLHRGLYEHVRFGGITAFQRHAKAVFAPGQVVTRVSFGQLRQTQKLADSPWLSHIRELDLAQCQALSGKELITLLSSPHLSSVRALLLPPVALRPEVFERIGTLSHLKDVHTLVFPHTHFHRYALSETVLRSLTESPYLTGLRWLEMGYLTTAVLELFWQAPNFGQLRTLKLFDCQRGSAGLAALQDGQRFASLQSLELINAGLGDEGGRHLAQAHSLRRLRHLNLASNLLGNASLQALCAGEPWPVLETLDLGHNAIGSAGVQALARSKAFPQLVGLNLFRNLVGDEGLWELGRSPHFPALRLLGAEYLPARPEIVDSVQRRFAQGQKPLRGEMPEAASRVSAPDSRSVPPSGHADEDGLLEAILAAPEDPVPRAIYADWLEDQGETDQAMLMRQDQECDKALLRRATPLIPDELRAALLCVRFDRGLLWVHAQMRGVLAKAFQTVGPAWLRRLRIFRLVLSGTTKDWSRVAAMPLLGQVRMLAIGPNSLKARGLADLLASPHFGRLFGLELTGNPLNGPGGLAPLLMANTLPNLCSLSLVHCQLSIAAIRELAQWQPSRPLKVLNLSENSFGAEGAALLVQSALCRELTQLHLNGCGIGDLGVKVLIEAPHLGQLTHLGLASNSLTVQGLRFLPQAPWFGQLRWLDLRQNFFFDLAQLVEVLASSGMSPQTRVLISRFYFRSEDFQPLRDLLGDRLVIV
jgi:uncharacterized protein (TIGR02996 family)